MKSNTESITSQEPTRDRLMKYQHKTVAVALAKDPVVVRHAQKYDGCYLWEIAQSLEVSESVCIHLGKLLKLKFHSYHLQSKPRRCPHCRAMMKSHYIGRFACMSCANDDT